MVSLRNSSGVIFLTKLGSMFHCLSIFESLIKKIWAPKTLRTYEKLGKPWGVVISETMLKFHDNDQRKIYRDNIKKEQ